MSANTPYSPPRAAVRDKQAVYGEVQIFSARGRIGRVRYLAYSFGFMVAGIVVLMALMGIVAAAAGFAAAMIVYAAGIIALIVVGTLFGIQRLHDLDKSGWLYLVMLIPLVGAFFSFYLIFAPGTKEMNRFGNPPPPNSGGVVLAAWLIPVFFMLIGILAAIAIPQYQKYVEKAKQAQIQTQPLEQQ